jgi:sortase A
VHVRLGGRDSTPSGRPRRRRAGFWLGLGFLLSGLSILGWLGWEYVGTNWVAHRSQHQAVAAFVAGRETSATALLKIPAFGSGYAMPIYPGVGDDVLGKGIGLFDGSSEPGGVGNYALIAHRITHGEPFAHLGDLHAGDAVEVETRVVHTVPTAAGSTRQLVLTTYTYVLDTNPKDLVVPSSSGWVLDPDPKNPGNGPSARQGAKAQIITLMTCSELFHTDNRMVAFGHLVKVVKSRPAVLTREAPS